MPSEGTQSSSQESHIQCQAGTSGDVIDDVSCMHKHVTIATYNINFAYCRNLVVLSYWVHLDLIIGKVHVIYHCRLCVYFTGLLYTAGLYVYVKHGVIIIQY